MLTLNWFAHPMLDYASVQQQGLTLMEVVDRAWFHIADFAQHTAQLNVMSVQQGTSSTH